RAIKHLSHYSHHPPEISTLSLHDALPIWRADHADLDADQHQDAEPYQHRARAHAELERKHERNEHRQRQKNHRERFHEAAEDQRSEEHTSELQSHLNLVCRLLLEKKNKTK